MPTTTRKPHNANSSPRLSIVPKMLFRTLTAALALCLLAVAAPVRAAEPLLTVLFTGNTYGTYAPCPS